MSAWRMGTHSGAVLMACSLSCPSLAVRLCFGGCRECSPVTRGAHWRLWPRCLWASGWCRSFIRCGSCCGWCDVAKSSGVDVRLSRTRSEWLVASVGAGVCGGTIFGALGFVLSSILNGVHKMGFGLPLLSLRPVYMGGIIVFAIVTGLALSALRPRVLSGGSGAGGGGSARRARVWAGVADLDVSGVNGPADEAVTDVRPV